MFINIFIRVLTLSEKLNQCIAATHILFNFLIFISFTQEKGDHFLHSDHRTTQIKKSVKVRGRRLCYSCKRYRNTGDDRKHMVVRRWWYEQTLGFLIPTILRREQHDGGRSGPWGSPGPLRPRSPSNEQHLCPR